MNSSTTTATIALTILSSPLLEDALEYIGDDELVEITPASIRLRKKVLEPGMRKWLPPLPSRVIGVPLASWLQ